jgi:hypothetical protein
MSYRNEVREVLQKATKLYTADEIGRLTSFPEETQRLSTILCQLVKEGEVTREGDPGSYRYKLNPGFTRSALRQKRSRRRTTPPAVTVEPAAGARAPAPAIPPAPPPKINGPRHDGLLAEERQLQAAIDARVDQIAATDPILRALIAEQKRLEKLIEETRP